MVKVNMAPVPIVVPVRIMLCGDVFAKAGKALSQLPCGLRARRLCARANDRRLCVGWMPKRREAGSSAFKARNTIWHAHSAKADTTSAAANSMCDLSATMEPTCLEAATAVETTTTASGVPATAEVTSATTAVATRHRQNRHRQILLHRRHCERPPNWSD